MSFRATATLAAFFFLALVSAARAQAPVQTSTQATAPPADKEFYSLREPAAAGDAQAQFALANHYFYGVGVPQDYSQALLWYNKFECIGRGRSAWCTKAELSDRADSETPRRLPLCRV